MRRTVTEEGSQSKSGRHRHHLYHHFDCTAMLRIFIIILMNIFYRPYIENSVMFAVEAVVAASTMPTQEQVTTAAAAASMAQTNKMRTDNGNDCGHVQMSYIAVPGLSQTLCCLACCCQTHAGPWRTRIMIFLLTIVVRIVAITRKAIMMMMMYYYYCGNKNPRVFRLRPCVKVAR